MTSPIAARVGGDAAAAVVAGADRSFADAMSTAATIGAAFLPA